MSEQIGMCSSKFFSPYFMFCIVNPTPTLLQVKGDGYKQLYPTTLLKLSWQCHSFQFCFHAVYTISNWPFIKAYLTICIIALSMCKIILGGNGSKQPVYFNSIRHNIHTIYPVVWHTNNNCLPLYIITILSLKTCRNTTM